jgi:hypothetical protein
MQRAGGVGQRSCGYETIYNLTMLGGGGGCVTGVVVWGRLCDSMLYPLCDACGWVFGGGG